MMEVAAIQTIAVSTNTFVGSGVGTLHIPNFLEMICTRCRGFGKQSLAIPVDVAGTPIRCRHWLLLYMPVAKHKEICG